MLNPVELILAKRGGKTLSQKDIESFITAFLDGSIPEYQMSALLMAIYFRGLDSAEIAALTKSYIQSGRTIEFPAELIVADKHSTGGVGDKISLMLAPIAASLGLTVPMISGRGLGHTGGTLDKLESIPGFRTQYSPDEFKALVEKHGCALVGQSEELVPADKRIYALRDVTATVESPGLITASIMSKKIAEGAKHLVIDLKIGSGAFMPDLDSARELARLLVDTGASFGQKVQVVFSNMNSPLGLAVGNGLEMVEAIEYLKGNPLSDTFTLTTALTSRLLLSGGLAQSETQAVEMIKSAVDSGRALAKLEEIIIAQGGDPRVLEDYSLLGTSSVKIPVLAETAGYVRAIDARAIGYALVRIKAGRMKVSDTLDYGAGALLIPKIGDFLEAGEPIGEIHANDPAQAELVARLVRAAYTLSSEPVPREDLILDSI
ncbi:MAG TPA: thymidine phosphorylase [Candidatus Syntrophosphaera sp.]|jgi:pyrimidine-nucleoside phosphorylase|nr:thymidine phosphorylase [Candidatus Syntrophosphaera sp.]HQH50263.1 thymidine phosphorylase [Candidatus Cloacimonadota bacterium]HPK83303.1 thymidine phosphorylase [Candidatus Syntrophosphaera sp.]HQK29536.1 thymidine phosphorylase [Candidatus Syntrophosphaera sp.]HRQ68093.1 thymidine phosphorylase [Candidatus Syntrophosphaera sp.]